MSVAYSDVRYWNNRYSETPDSTFDWYTKYSAIKELIVPRFSEKSRILVVGSGNSLLSASLYDEGYQNITNIDISDIVVEQMNQKFADRPGMQWANMDARKLDFPSESFDVVIDKGCLDCLFTGTHSYQNVGLCLKEITRILVPSGCYICISYRDADHRLSHFNRDYLNWSVVHKSIPKSLLEASEDPLPANCYHVFTCLKNERTVPLDDSDEDDD